METVFLLQHSRDCGDGHEDVKLIGVYASEQLARKALDRVRDQPGFREYPDGFDISAVRLNESSWLEGFGIPWPEEV